MRRIGLQQAQRSTRWAFMERFEVPNLDDPTLTYLTRWRVVQTPWFSIYVHKIGTPDSRELHDHPWSFLSLVLRGGYRERRSYDSPLVRVRRLNLKRSTDLHYIAELDRTPTWTFLLVGPRRRDWGYVDRDGQWTRFDLHPRNEQFQQALAARGGS
jgi:hypothetical protein